MLLKKLFGGRMKADQAEINTLRQKVKSLQETVDLQLELIEKLQDENIKLSKDKARLQKKAKKNV
jgi:hypothetical protein